MHDATPPPPPTPASPAPVLSASRSYLELVIIVGVAFMVVLCSLFLGSWQYDRYTNKRDRANLVMGNYAASPVPLSRLISDPAAAPVADNEWRPVEVRGQYLSAKTMLIRNRPNPVRGVDGGYGYDVLVPLRQNDGTIFWINRGWLPGDPGAGKESDLPAPPKGQVRVLATLRLSEPARAQNLPDNQLGSIATDQLATVVAGLSHRGYGTLRSETTPLGAERPQANTSLSGTKVLLTLIPPPTVDDGRGINASYAVQWVLLAVLAVSFPLWWWWRRGSINASSQPKPRLRKRRSQRQAALHDADAEDAEIERSSANRALNA
ncbi:MAG: SURF1 family protein [Actinomycetota bacterium]